ncbi:MAG: insulinase family protein [Anaerolineales bacterium]|nr:insulinase family protein [Anaerolineales bacterium]
MSASLQSIPGPDDIIRANLPNGITVLTRPNFNSPAVSIIGYLQVGSLFDPDEKLGLSDFTASALMRGTTGHNFQDLYNTLESVGASLTFSGATHTTGFNGKTLAEDIDLVLNILSDVLRHPTFPAKQIAQLRAQHLTSLAIRAQNTGEMASLTFDKIVYKDHPYSRPEDGYPETVKKITREDLVKFHQTHYGPSGLVIAIVGAIDSQLAIEKVAETMGDWENPDQPTPPNLPPVHPLTKVVKEKVNIPGKFQSNIIIGSSGPPRNSSDYLAAALGNSVLGQFGMMGRIGEVVREKAGLAYYAYSSLSGGVGPGPWSVTAGVNPANVDKVNDLIREEIRRFVSEPVSEEELNDSRESSIGMMPLALESNLGVATAILNIVRYNLGLDYYIKFEEMLRAITVDQVLKTAQRYLDPDKLAIAIAGP